MRVPVRDCTYRRLRACQVSTSTLKLRMYVPFVLVSGGQLSFKRSSLFHTSSQDSLYTGKTTFNKTNTTLNRQCKTFVVQRDTKTNKQNDNKVSKDGFVWCCCCCNVLGPPCGGFPRIRFARATTVCKSFFWCFSLSLFSILVFGFYYRLHTHKCRNKSKRIWKFGLPDCNVNSWH